MRALIWILLLLVMACVDPLNIKLANPQMRLIVDGLITNLPGPYQVKLFNSVELSSANRKRFEPVTSAQVFIVDDLQHKYLLTEISPGIYETNENELTGEIGRSYYLTIKTVTGIQYESNPQRLANPGEITDLYFEFQEQPKPQFSDELKIFIDAKGVSEGDNLFRWRWTTIHKTKSNPELHTEDTPGGGVRPAPEPCSGYVYQGRLIQVGECTCCFCWSYNYSDGAFVSHNEFVSENQFNKQFLGSIPVTSMHFYDRYYIEVQQLSLTEEAYDFWNLVEKQQKGSTDIFQPNSIKIRGNIQSVTNPDEPVLGFFEVSGAAIKSLYIPESEALKPLPPIEMIPFSCLEYFKNPSNEKPFFW